MSKSNMDEFNREKWKMPRWTNYTASLIAVIFLAFLLGWLFLIPVVAAVLLVYGLVVYMRDRKNRITVTIKQTEAMKAIARREEELKRDKERVLYEEIHDGMKR
jgi:preprotein translocase subunit SecY